MRYLKRLSIVLLILAIAYAVFYGSAGVEVEDGSILLVELEGSYLEGPEPPLLMRLLGRAEEPMAGVLSDFAKAARDERIDTVVIRIRELQVGWAKVQEFRDAITRLREAGRETVAYIEIETFGANKEFYLATAADRVVLAPGTRGPLIGLAAEFFFLGGLWEKLGIEMEVERVGKYKSAAESLAGREMSEPSREMAHSMLDSMNAEFIKGVAEGRKLTPVLVRAAIDEAPYESDRLRQLGLIDDVLFYDELLSQFDGAPEITGAEYAGVEPEEVGFEPVAKFAVIYGSGGVTRRERSAQGGPVLNAMVVSALFDELAEDPEVAAIIFRVDSPGGSPLASDMVWRAVVRAKARKPVVASFSDLAASGGYYVACAADKIVAEPGSLTGSIGVFAMRPVLGGLLTKLGIGFDSIVKSENAEIQLSTRPLSDAGRRRFRADITAAYDQFLDRVAVGRGMSVEQVHEVAQGRVWTGSQALEVGLVDALGGVREAAREAKLLLGIDPEADVALYPYPQPKPLAEQIGAVLGGGVSAYLPDPLKELGQMLSLVPAGAPAALPPFLVKIY